MNNEPTTERTGITLRLALLVTMFFAVILAGIWISLYLRHIEATSCATQQGSSKLKTLTGKISKHSDYAVPFYLSSADQNVVLSNYSRRSQFNDTLSNSIGRSASATFCDTELLSLDVQGKRVFTKDTAFATLLLFGVVFALIVIFIFAISLYGHKRISLPKERA